MPLQISIDTFTIMRRKSNLFVEVVRPRHIIDGRIDAPSQVLQNHAGQISKRITGSQLSWELRAGRWKLSSTWRRMWRGEAEGGVPIGERQSLTAQKKVDRCGLN